MFLNKCDVDQRVNLVEQGELGPNLSDAITVLANLVNWTNSVCDGWGHWAKPSRAAETLMTTLSKVTPWDVPSKDLSKAELNAMLRPIKEFLTQEGFDPSEVFPARLMK